MLQYEANLKNYIPPSLNTRHVTLTWAQSLDSKISQGHGIRTTLSHPETKEMTQYLRSKHQGILVGSGTVLSDDPGLNCKKSIHHSPSPIIVDPSFKFLHKFENSKLRSLYLMKLGKPPIFVITEEAHKLHIKYTEERTILGEFDILIAPTCEKTKVIPWKNILDELDTKFGIKSIMIEGGAYVINDLLSLYPHHINSVVVTVAPVFLGDQGVTVHPSMGKIDLENVTNFTGLTDVVMCGQIKQNLQTKDF